MKQPADLYGTDLYGGGRMVLQRRRLRRGWAGNIAMRMRCDVWSWKRPQRVGVLKTLCPGLYRRGGPASAGNAEGVPLALCGTDLRVSANVSATLLNPPSLPPPPSFAWAAFLFSRGQGCVRQRIGDPLHHSRILLPLPLPPPHRLTRQANLHFFGTDLGERANVGDPLARHGPQSERHRFGDPLPLPL